MILTFMCVPPPPPPSALWYSSPGAYVVDNTVITLGPLWRFWLSVVVFGLPDTSLEFAVLQPEPRQA